MASSLKLRKGGTELYVNDDLKVAAPMAEYEDIYVPSSCSSRPEPRRWRPLHLVSDCFMLGRRVDTKPLSDA
jgi:hypothetical protein